MRNANSEKSQRKQIRKRAANMFTAVDFGERVFSV